MMFVGVDGSIILMVLLRRRWRQQVVVKRRRPYSKPEIPEERGSDNVMDSSGRINVKCGLRVM
jgi:hypothetical protein